MMIKAILFDLDNTLIANPGLPFVQEYLRLGGEHFFKTWGYDGFSRVAMRILGALSGVRPDPQVTNSQLGTQMIAEAAGCEFDTTAVELQSFYSETYRSLQSCITQMPEAIRVVEKLQAEGYAIVIATNPIYPAVAIRQRLQWGGFSPDLDKYSFVTHADNMHFVKPSSAYYAEILARIGLEPDEAIMVGDDRKNDIRPAAALGMHTFHVSPQSCGNSNSGTIQEFHAAMMSDIWQGSLLRHPLDPAMVEPQMRGNIGAMFGLMDSMKSHFWDQHPDPDEWSPLQIVCHLWESEDEVQRPRLERIVNEDNPFLAAPREPLGPRKFSCFDSGEDYAKRFASSREKTIQWIQTLDGEDWSRPARHSIFGPTTLLEMAHFTAQHDRLHLNQLCQTLGNCE